MEEGKRRKMGKKKRRVAKQSKSEDGDSASGENKMSLYAGEVENENEDEIMEENVDMMSGANITESTDKQDLSGEDKKNKTDGGSSRPVRTTVAQQVAIRKALEELMQTEPKDTGVRRKEGDKSKRKQSKPQSLSGVQAAAPSIVATPQPKKPKSKEGKNGSKKLSNSATDAYTPVDSQIIPAEVIPAPIIAPSFTEYDFTNSLLNPPQTNAATLAEVYHNEWSSLRPFIYLRHFHNRSPPPNLHPRAEKTVEIEGFAVKQTDSSHISRFLPPTKGVFKE